MEGIRGLDIQGVSVTLPFKTEVMKYLDEVEGNALRIGAVNTIRNHQGRLMGYNTDWLGFVLSLKEGLEIRGKKFAVLGAGGAARGVVYGLIQEGGTPDYPEPDPFQGRGPGKGIRLPIFPSIRKEKN